MSDYELSTDNVTWESAPIDPKVEYKDAEEMRRRGDQQQVGLGAGTLRWYFGEQPVDGTDFYWFQSWITAGELSTSIYVKTLVPGVADATGASLVYTMRGVMGKPTGVLDGLHAAGQRFMNVEMFFWDLVAV